VPPLEFGLANEEVMDAGMAAPNELTQSSGSHRYIGKSQAMVWDSF